jgi:hypothetical protein
MLKARNTQLHTALIVGLISAAWNPSSGQRALPSAPLQTVTDVPHSSSIAPYVNKRYGFSFRLPATWVGYKIVVSEWTGEGEAEHGSMISIRHPLWTKESPRQDIYIMVFTHEQWRKIQRGTLNVSAAPYPPSELGRNNRFVFAFPPRPYVDELDGYQEVIKIMGGKPLRAF